MTNVVCVKKIKNILYSKKYTCNSNMINSARLGFHPRLHVCLSVCTSVCLPVTVSTTTQNELSNISINTNVCGTNGHCQGQID